MAKVYVVWRGRKPGVYATWAECEAQVKGYPQAKYKAFPTREMAEQAFRGEAADFVGKTKPAQLWLLSPNPPRTPCLCVDAACSGVPGPVEYQGVRLPEGKRVFHQGPFPQGTNNIGEFLGIVHALGWLKQRDLDWPVYSDSQTAIAWVRAGKCRTEMARTAVNAPLFDLVARAEAWLAKNGLPAQVLKWDTQAWGEIPADFGRK